MTELTVATREVDGITLLYPTGLINAHTVRVFESEMEAIRSFRPAGASPGQ